MAFLKNPQGASELVLDKTRAKTPQDNPFGVVDRSSEMTSFFWTSLASSCAILSSLRRSPRAFVSGTFSRLSLLPDCGVETEAARRLGEGERADPRWWPLG